MFPYREGVPNGRKKKWKTLAPKWKTDFLPGVDWVGGRSNQGRGFNVSRAPPLELEKKRKFIKLTEFFLHNLYIIEKGGMSWK